MDQSDAVDLSESCEDSGACKINKLLDSYSIQSTDDRLEQDGNDRICNEFNRRDINATTIGTIVVRCGPIQLVIALLQSPNNIFIKVVEVEPKITVLGLNIEDSIRKQNDHDNILENLQNLPGPMKEFIFKVDKLLAKKRISSELVNAMARTLNVIWLDILNLMHEKHHILHLCTQFHVKMSHCFFCMDQLEMACLEKILPLTVIEAQELLNKFKQTRIDMLTAVMAALKDGNELLAQLHSIENKETLDTRPEHIKRDALRSEHQVQQWLESLHDRRNILEASWQKRKSQLEKCLALALLSCEFIELEEALNRQRNSVSNSFTLGDCELTANNALENYQEWKLQALQFRDRALKMTRAKEKLQDPSMCAEDWSCASAYAVLNLCTEHLDLIDRREHWLTQAREFFLKAKNSLLVLEKLEEELSNTLLPNSLHDVNNFSAESLQLGNAIVNEAGCTPQEVQGVKRVLDEIENRKIYIKSICVASNEDQQRVHNALLDFFTQYEELLNWVKSVDKTHLQQYRLIGQNLEDAKAFLLKHHELMQDLEIRGDLINKLLESIKVKLNLLSAQQRYEVDSKADLLHKHWIELKKNILTRVDFVSLLILFFEKVNELHVQLDCLQKHLKQTPDAEKFQVVELTWRNIQSGYDSLKGYGIKFGNIKIEDPYIMTKPSTDAVEDILNGFWKCRFDVEKSLESWTSYIESKREVETMLETIMSQNEETANKTTKVDSQLYPVLSPHTIDEKELCDLARAKLENVNRDIETAQDEIQQRKQATFSIQAKDQESLKKIEEVIEKLEALKLKLDNIKYEYRLLLENILQFLENASKLKFIIKKYVEEKLQQQSAESGVQEMIIEHKNFCDVCMDKFRSLIIQSELVIDRVRILEPAEACEIDIDRILKILENIRIYFESKSTDRMLKLELLEKLEQFKFDLSDFDNSLNSVHMQLAEINEQSVDNLASAKTASLAFEYFERTVELLEKRIDTFIKTTSQQLLKKDPEKEANFNRELKNLIEKWQTIKEEVQQKRRNLNKATAFFEVVEKIEIEYREMSYFYKCVLQKVPNICDSIEALNLVNDIEKYLTSREERLRSKLDFAVKCSHNKIKVSTLYTDVIALFQSFTKLKSDIKTDQDRIKNEKNKLEKCENATLEQKVINQQKRNLTTHNLVVCENDLQSETKSNFLEEQAPEDKLFKNIKEYSISESTFKPLCGQIECQKEGFEGQTVDKDRLCFQTLLESKNTKGAFTNLKYTLPYFKSLLKDALVRESETFIFECEVAGDPEPEIKWFKDGFSIDDNADYKTSYQSGLCSLLIEETLATDSARFTCRASNLVGSIACTALLLVKENLNEVEMIPPRIVQFLKSGHTTEGGTFQFTCAITGNPLPILQWFKNDKCIDNSPDYKIQSKQLNDIEEATLKFEKVFLEDDAVYTCRASNPVGIEHCSASLFVEPLEPTEKPYFKIPLSNAMVRVGQKIKLEALIRGIPHPDVYWLHNGKPFTPLEAKYDHGRVVLIISHAYPKDAGVYVLIAKNIAGEVKTMCNVHVKGRLQNETSDSEMASDMDPVQPAVQMPLKAVSVYEGKSIRLDCEIIGQPEPEVIWFHNGQPIKESADVQLLFQGDRCSLIIQEVYQEDAGIYKVVAINSAGETSSSCNVTVEALKLMGQKLEVQLKGSLSPKDLLPKFEKFLSDLLVHEGDIIELEVVVSGEQPLSAKWFLANKELSENEYINFEANVNTGLFKLIIRNVSAKDQGVYMVKISNNVGDAKCFSNVIIKSINILENQQKPQVEVIENPECPEFQEIFVSQNVSTGDLVKFECIVKGKPSPKVFWNFNDQSIHGENYQISRSGNRNVLIIQEANSETVGKVSCIAENEAGKAICEAFLKLNDVGSQAQSSINSMHTVTQEHNNETSCVTTKKKTLDTFIISQVNSFEEKLPHTKEPHFLNNIGSFRQELKENTICNTDDQTKANFEMQYSGNLNGSSCDVLPTCFHKDVVPRFTTPLSGKIADEGTDVILDAIYDGIPTPKIWIEKDGEKLVENNKIIILIQNKCVTIELKNVCVSNAGRYTITASNILGHSTSTADLVVKKTVFPPVFGKRLLAQIAKMGDLITMDVEVTGLPEPTVIWLKDNIPIENAGISKHRVLSVGNSFKLVIEKAQISDSGKYMVMAKNFGGEAKSIADFAVLDPTPGHMNEDVKIIDDDMLNKFKTEIFDKRQHSYHTNQSQEKIATDLNGSSLSKIITERRCTTQATMRLEHKSSNLDIPKLSFNPKSLTNCVSNIKPSFTIYSDMPDWHQEKTPSKATLLNTEVIKATREANKMPLQTKLTQFSSEALASGQSQIQHHKSTDENQYSNNFKHLELQPGSPSEICYIPSIDVTKQILSEIKCKEEVEHEKLSKKDPPILLFSDASGNLQIDYNESNVSNLDYIRSPSSRASTNNMQLSKLWTPTQVSKYEMCGTSDIDQEKIDITLEKHSSDSKKCIAYSLTPEVTTTQSTPELISSATSSLLLGSPHEICYAPKMKAEIKDLKTEGKNEKDNQCPELKTNVSDSLLPLTPPAKYSFKLNNITLKPPPPVLSNKVYRRDYCESDYDSDRWKFSGSESDEMCHYLKKTLEPNYKTSGYVADTEESKQIKIQSTKIHDSGKYPNLNQEYLSQYSANNIDKKDYKLITTSIANNSPQNISTNTVINSQIESSYATSRLESATKEARSNVVIGQKSPVVVITPPPMKLEMTSFPTASFSLFKFEPTKMEVNDDIKKNRKQENQQILLNNEFKQKRLSPIPIKQQQQVPFLHHKLAKPTIYYNAFTGTPLHTVSEAIDTKNFVHTKNLKKGCELVNIQETNTLMTFDRKQVKESTKKILNPLFCSPRQNTTFIQQAHLIPISMPTKFIPGEFRESDYESRVDNIKIHPLWSPSDAENKATKAYRHVAPPKFIRSQSVPRSYNRVLSPMEFDQGPEFFSKSHVEMNSVCNSRLIDTKVVQDNNTNTQSYKRSSFMPNKSIKAIIGSRPIYGVIQSQCDKHCKIDKNLITKMKYTGSDENKVIGATCGLRRHFKRAPSEGNNRLETYSWDSAAGASQFDFGDLTSTHPINSYEIRYESVPKIPYFSTPLKDIAVKIANNARFECIVQSSPTPHVVWTQNGVVLECNNHVFIEYRNGICRLTLINVDQNDSGYYTCSATNSSGVSTTSGKLNVSNLSQRY